MRMFAQTSECMGSSRFELRRVGSMVYIYIYIYIYTFIYIYIIYLYLYIYTYMFACISMNFFILIGFLIFLICIISYCMYAGITFIGRNYTMD